VPSKKQTTKPIPQQDFLRDAMQRLSMTRKQLAARLSTPERRLNNWLLPTTSAGYRELDPTIWQFIREIVAAHEKKANE
jgi:aspartate carbamoyltransferase catalytic subunit